MASRELSYLVLVVTVCGCTGRPLGRDEDVPRVVFDAATPRDLVATVDLAVPRDLAVLEDLSPTIDLTALADLTLPVLDAAGPSSSHAFMFGPPGPASTISYDGCIDLVIVDAASPRGSSIILCPPMRGEQPVLTTIALPVGWTVAGGAYNAGLLATTSASSTGAISLPSPCVIAWSQLRVSYLQEWAIDFGSGSAAITNCH